MNAFLRFLNGDVQEIKLDPSHIRDGHPVSTIVWSDGERDFWLDVPAYRDHRIIRYHEVDHRIIRYHEVPGSQGPSDE